MTKKQKAKLTKIIKSDCKTRHVYFSPNGETCVIGAMLKAVGVKLKSPVWNKEAVGKIPYDHIARLIEIFGLIPDELRRLQIVNDAWAETEERREKVLGALNDLPCD